VDGVEGKVRFVWQVADLLRGDYRPVEAESADAESAHGDHQDALVSADAIQKIISTETWKAARRKHAETAA
jgi:hypothetical protein